MQLELKSYIMLGWWGQQALCWGDWSSKSLTARVRVLLQECQQSSSCRMGNTSSNLPPEGEVRTMLIHFEENKLKHLFQGNSHPLVPAWCWLWHLPSAVDMSEKKCKHPVSLQLLNIQYFRPCSTHLLTWMTMSNSFSGLRKQKRSWRTWTRFSVWPLSIQQLSIHSSYWLCWQASASWLGITILVSCFSKLTYWFGIKILVSWLCWCLTRHT